MRSFANYQMAGLLIVLVCSQAGCLTLTSLLKRESPPLDTSLLRAQGYSIPPGGMPMQVQPSGSAKPSVVLEIRDEHDARHAERIPVPMDQGFFIEDVVQQARLHEKFGELQISIMRPNGMGAPPVRLELRTDDDGKATSIGSNYALLPGDHIVVNEDRRSALEKYIFSRFPSF